MSRMSVRTFLVTAKKQLRQALKDNGHASFVIGNESADLDSVTCALVYGYLQSSRPEERRANRLLIPVTNIPAADLTLRPELTALLEHAGIKPSELITLDDLGKLPLPLSSTSWTLVDHNALQGSLSEHYSSSVTAVIDHHDDEQKVSSESNPRVIEKAGSCSSLVAHYCRETWDAIASASSSVGAALGQSSDGVVDDAAYTSTWDAQVAKLALGSILIDTHNLTDESKVTDHDRKAVRYLEARINASPKFGKDYDRKAFFEELNAAKTHLDGLSLEDILRKDYKQWSEGELTLGISSVVKPVEYLQDKAESDFVQSLVTFAKERKLQLYAVMTSYTTESGGFARQLLLLSLDHEKSSDAAQSFAETCTDELQLQDGKLDSLSVAGEGVEKIPWMRLWDQKNVGASRKRVGPLLREAMR
ncbi:hypothetical protein LTR36_010420 [Oleoguttula mirabilis]|uniref:DHHA2 domain-containing protein n=1 Tax=Oleoguttula mirabilis TaxID=1507867 RepID=A0AAV9J4G3_9PEZI|nr:hypothetical protein LTR36_010420 [Oleoguttula mirabilis]